jgi:hypothetical protein
MKKLFAIALLAMVLSASQAYAGCGGCPGDAAKGAAKGAACAHGGAAGDKAAVLKEAVEALKATNPELADKVQKIADMHCDHGAH